MSNSGGRLEHARPCVGRYDRGMCSHAEWEKLRCGVEKAVESEEVRDLLAEAAVRVMALIDGIRRWDCASENAEWVRRCQPRSRTEWVV